MPIGINDLNAILAAEYSNTDDLRDSLVWTRHLAALHARADSAARDHPALDYLRRGHLLIHTGDNSTLADDYARHLARDHTDLHLTGTSAQLARFHDDHGGCWYHLDRHTAGADAPPRNRT